MKKTYNNNEYNSMSLIEHLDELRVRLFFVLFFFLIVTIISFIEIKDIINLLQQPAYSIKFLQLAPGEFFFVSIKIALYLGLTFTSPFAIYQTILFILPGLTKKETVYIIPILIGSVLLFFVGLIFSYIILMPAALNFFINYGSDIVEPLWSFEEYFNFILLISFSTGISFQIPIIQILLGIFNIFSSEKMLYYWKYIFVSSTIFSALVTPSTDPITQISLSFALILLYFTSILVLKALKK
uniref:Sec-independent protein translocase component TatC n=1 Tax=Taenioma perpusillum TaxID=210852 RepID=A0A1Z1MQZ2_9FLOR|nr:Sec-independent protein translocase component TatC [Taenioma perpusillum]ARW68513.1 Sec-independent protein translocase component TatC [Taenioma perpusillum]